MLCFLFMILFLWKIVANKTVAHDSIDYAKKNKIKWECFGQIMSIFKFNDVEALEKIEQLIYKYL